ncbi:MAG: sugar transferase [Acholeplasmatales bacterium]|nr:sugar transferase [Acholeplasmatales bacterium]
MRRSVKESLTLEYNMSMYKKKPLYAFFNRLFDIVLSLVALIAFSWLFLIIAIAVKVTSKGPVFYGHERVGKNGKTFKVFKFRSMVIDNRPLEEILTPEQLEEWHRDFKVTDDPRVTKVGKILRKTSLDELPQLLNILFGQMSIVGWRPILQEELDMYGENAKLLTKQKPGLTGFWASHGRSNTTYSERIKMELYGVVKRNLIMNIRIIFHTFFGVLKRNGAK